jgi:hypothetical protein
VQLLSPFSPLWYGLAALLSLGIATLFYYFKPQKSYPNPWIQRGLFLLKSLSTFLLLLLEVFLELLGLSVLIIDAEGHLSPFRSLTAHMCGSPVCGVVPGGACPGLSRPSRESVSSAAMGSGVATKGRESTAV